ncbi:MAG: hypothetical protein ABW022_11850 [Actinoplanes sp.]
MAFELSTGSAAADQARELPISSVADLVVDGAHQRIFISDPIGGRLITTSYAGEVLATSTGLPGVTDLVLADRLYAAVPGNGTIVAFDPVTTTKTATYATGGAPRTLAAAAGKIWFGEDGRGLGSLDLSGATPVVTRGASFVGDLPKGAHWSKAPQLATTPSRPDVVAAVDTGTTASRFSILDVSTDPPTPTALREIGEFAHALTFSADGSRLIVSSATIANSALSANDLSTIEEYPTPGTARAFAVRRDGALAIANSDDEKKAVAVFAPGAATPTKHFDLRPTGPGSMVSMYLTPAVAWEPGGDRLFGVANDQSRYSLQVLNDPTKAPVTIQLSVPATVQPNQGFRVRGTVSTRLVQGFPLVITRTDASMPGGRRIGPQTVPFGDGNSFEFEDVESTAGTITYTVSIPGDDHLDSATATASVPVAAVPSTTLTLDRHGSAWAYGATVTFTAKLGATGTSRVVEIWADPFGNDQPNRLLRKASVDSKGTLTAGLKLSRNTTLSAVYRGDEKTLPKTVKSTVSVKASVTTEVFRHYKYAKIGSVPYYHFRKSTHPVFKTTMNPYPGRKQYLQIDVHSRGKWILWGYFYLPLDSAGRSSKQLPGTHSVGVRYRERSVYQYGQSGDTANTTTYGTYRYYTFTR